MTTLVERYYHVHVNGMEIKFRTKIELYDFLAIHKEVKDVYVRTEERLEI